VVRCTMLAVAKSSSEAVVLHELGFLPL